MSSFRHRYQTRDIILLSGWLFADLLLGLAVIFLAAVPGAVPRLIELAATPGTLGTTACGRTPTHLQCVVRLTETARSQGPVNWTASSDISQAVTFLPPQGILAPGRSITVRISAIPCQNGSFIFHGSGNANPVIVLWNCTPVPERLEHTYCRLVLRDQDANRFSQDVTFAESVLEPQIAGLTFLQGRQIGIAVANGGVDDINSATDRDRGINIAKNTYLVLQDLANRGSALFARTSYYDPLFTGYFPSSDAVIDIYLVIRQDNPADTCGTDHAPYMSQFVDGLS